MTANVNPFGRSGVSAAAGRLVAIVVSVLPYAAVLLGMYVLRSAWSAILLYHAGICAVVLATGGVNGFRAVLHGWNRPAALASLSLLVLGGVSSHVLWPIAGNVDLQVTLTSFGLHDLCLLGFVVYYCIVNAWLEELYWRGMIADRLGSLSDVLFAGYHVLVLYFFVKPVWLLVCFMVLVLSSRMWRYMMSRFGGVLTPAIAHFSAGAGIMGMVYLLAA